MGMENGEERNNQIIEKDYNSLLSQYRVSEKRKKD